MPTNKTGGGSRGGSNPAVGTSAQSRARRGRQRNAGRGGSGSIIGNALRRARTRLTGGARRLGLIDR